MNEISNLIVASTEQNNSTYWDQFYKTSVTKIPSQFAALVASEMKSPHVVIDIGCGNGRDSFFFNELGHIVVGLDASRTAILTNQNNIANSISPRILFFEHSVGLDSLQGVFDTLDKLQTGSMPCVLYSRFFLHAISEEAEDHLINQISVFSGRIKTLFLEYRELKDAGIEKTFSDHYRRFIDADALAQKITERTDFALDYQVVSRGFAKFGSEDPWISRQIFHKSR